MEKYVAYICVLLIVPCFRSNWSNSIQNESISRTQLFDASKNGRVDEVVDLLDEGANIEFKYTVRPFVRHA
jgi:hypothetical protein